MSCSGVICLNRNTVKGAWSVKRHVMENRRRISLQQWLYIIYEKDGDPITIWFKLHNNALSRRSLNIVRQSLLKDRFCLLPVNMVVYLVYSQRSVNPFHT